MKACLLILHAFWLQQTLNSLVRQDDGVSQLSN